MNILLILTLVGDIGFIPLPEDSREFAHWACPLITSEIGSELTGLAIDRVSIKKTPFEKELIKLGGGMLFSIIMFKVLDIDKHYVTPREYRLNNSGLGCWGSFKVSVNLIKLFTDKHHSKILMPTPIRIRTRRLIPVQREEGRK